MYTYYVRKFVALLYISTSSGSSPKMFSFSQFLQNIVLDEKEMVQEVFSIKNHLSVDIVNTYSEGR